MPAPVGESVKFHLSLNVADIPRAATFYRALLNQTTSKQTAHYAKFELDDPPLVLSLVSARPAPGGTLNHVGLRLPSSDALVQTQIRLGQAGIATKLEEGVECCQSRQTKFWATDPDGTLWELYIFHEDIEAEEERSHAGKIEQTAPVNAPGIIWQHHIPQPFPSRIPHDDNAVHEVVLEGTANMKQKSVWLQTVLSEVWRVLRPGGEVRLHGLVGDKPFKTDPPNLPGPAAVVEHVPLETAPLQAMLRTGFVQVRFEKLSPAPNFVVHGVAMREILLSGLKPGHRPRAAHHQAIYLGPLAQVTDDFGNVFPRGERVSLNIHDWQHLDRSALAGQFLLLTPPQAAGPKKEPCC